MIKVKFNKTDSIFSIFQYNVVFSFLETQVKCESTWNHIFSFSSILSIFSTPTPTWPLNEYHITFNVTNYRRNVQVFSMFLISTSLNNQTLLWDWVFFCSFEHRSELEEMESEKRRRRRRKNVNENVSLFFHYRSPSPREREILIHWNERSENIHTKRVTWDSLCIVGLKLQITKELSCYSLK